MKYGNVEKSDGGSYSADIMAKVNKFSRRELKAEEVYIFPVVMCDNELDRQEERFTEAALRELAELFIGKTFICDHERKNANQTARIFDTEVVKSPTEKVFDGEPLCQLTCKAYMLRNEATQPIIDNIEAGIYKEVSVGCAVGSQKCSICGEEYYGGKCVHFRGKMYDGKKCFLTLSDAKDAYELSFVAVPAQPGAGVTKWYDGDDDAKKKGMIKTMNYEETKKALAAFGIDLDGITKEKDTVPPLADILAAVQKAFDSKCTATIESTAEFLSADTVKAAAGKEMSADEVIALIKGADENAEKAKLYDALREKAVAEAVKSGVKAMGETFGEERWKKIFKGFSVEEINAQAAEWEQDAKKALKTGRTSEITEKASESLAIGNLEDYRF